MEQFEYTLLHPYVNLNLASVSFLKVVLEGKDCDEFCREILKERVTRKFVSIADVEEFFCKEAKIGY